MTIAEAYQRPPPSCSVVQFRLPANPGKSRLRFGQQLSRLSETVGMEFHGFIKRSSNSILECLIVVEPCNEEDLGQLYIFLRNKWLCAMADITFEKTNYNHVGRLQRRFEIVRSRDEQEGWSGEGFEDFCAYSVVTHITND